MRSSTQDNAASHLMSNIGAPARNILELDRKFQTVYASGTSHMTSTARSRSNHFNSHMDKKITNIIFKLKTRFNRDDHKARNEEIVKRMREKHARMHVDFPMHLMQQYNSVDLDDVATTHFGGSAEDHHSIGDIDNQKVLI